MQKKKLLQLPVLPLEDNLELPLKSPGQWGETYNYILRAVKTNDEILIVDLFRPNGEFLRRHFQSKQGEYFSWNYKENRLSYAGADMWMPWYDSHVHTDSQSEQVIKKFLPDIPPQESARRTLIISNQEIKKRKLAAERQKKIDEVHSNFTEIKPLPKAVKQWVKSTLMKDSRYIFYQSQPSKKETEGICSHCGKTVTIKKPKDGETGKCPECKSRVIYKPKGRFLKSRGFADRSAFVYLQPTSKGFCVRAFTAKYEFKPKDIDCLDKREAFVYETNRDFYEYRGGRFTPAARFFYDRRLDLGGIMEWEKSSYQQYQQCVGTLYPKGLNKLLKHEKFKAWHTDFELIAKKCGALVISTLVNAANEQVLIGHMANMGLYRLAAALINDSRSTNCIDKTQTSIKKALHCGKDELAIYKKLNISLDGLQLFQQLLNKGEKIEIADFKYITQCSLYSTNKLLKHMTLHRLVRYCKENSAAYSLITFLSDYKDYIEMAEAVGYNLAMDSIKFPRNFKKAHDEVAKLCEEIERESQKAKLETIAKMEKEYTDRFYYADKKYIIRPPKDHAELIAEGKALSHCVAKYALDIAKRKSIILFIRKAAEPDKPFYTLELDPQALIIRQNRGYKNHTDDKAVQIWAQKWLKNIVHLRCSLAVKGTA